MKHKVYMAACYIAYLIVLALPIRWRLSWWFLPHAGFYAYADDEWRWKGRRDDPRHTP